jgi:hypothetical protein
MLRIVRVIAIAEALDAVCWLLEMVGARLLSALVEDLLSFAGAHFGT